MNLSPNIQTLIELNDQALLLTEYEEALIGFSERDTGEIVAVYATHKIVETIMKLHQCDYWEAIDYYDYNVLGSKLDNVNAPIIVDLFDNIVCKLSDIIESNADSDEPISPGDDDGLDGRAY